MGKKASNERQDPAEQKKVDEAVVTEEQAPESEPVEVTAPAPTSTDTKTHTSHGTIYTVDPDRGFRVQG